MNDIKKTGIFWGVAGLILAVALVVSQSGGTTSDTSDPSKEKIGEPLFEDFKDPAVAASMKIVTFDEVQGQIGSFEVRKDPVSGQWTIPSRNGYPADATDQMATAANSLIDLQVLDVQTTNAEDHDDLGVIEPKIEDLEIGDEGVGRLVAFKDESQKTIASMIIGKPSDSDPSKIYVRIPGQNPVYVVRFDDAPLSTDFQRWIEEDLLQLSSIDVTQMEIKDYNASLGVQGFSWNRNFTATLIQDGTNWLVENILDYNPRDPNADPVKATVSPTDTPNATKFNEMKNSLDDLKIVDVLRKPDGMSANLRADKELVSDQAAVESLSRRGFFPLQQTQGGEIDILSANGEMVVTLNDGVQYVLRFGEVSGVDEVVSDDDSENSTGVNRYMLVTARVDETQFPLVGLQEIPQTLEELEALLNPKPEQPAADATPEEKNVGDDGLKTATENLSADEDAAAPEQPKGDAEPEMKEPATAGDKPAETDPAETEPAETEPESAEEAATEKAAEAEDTVQEKSAIVEGEGTGTGSGGGQADNDEADNDETDNDDDKIESAEPEATAEESAAVADDDEAAELTDEEKLELLAAEQEKIGKANQRLIDSRNDKIEIARRRVRELNARFADWYYVIPEETYAKLRVKRTELFESATTPAALGPPGASSDLPSFTQQGPGGN